MAIRNIAKAALFGAALAGEQHEAGRPESAHEAAARHVTTALRAVRSPQQRYMKSCTSVHCPTCWLSLRTTIMLVSRHPA